MHKPMHTYIQTYIHTVYTCVCVCRLYTRVYVCVCVCVYIHMYIYIYIYIYICILTYLSCSIFVFMFYNGGLLHFSNLLHGVRAGGCWRVRFVVSSTTLGCGRFGSSSSLACRSQGLRHASLQHLSVYEGHSTCSCCVGHVTFRFSGSQLRIQPKATDPRRRRQHVKNAARERR